MQDEGSEVAADGELSGRCGHGVFSLGAGPARRAPGCRRRRPGRLDGRAGGPRRTAGAGERDDDAGRDLHVAVVRGAGDRAVRGRLVGHDRASRRSATACIAAAPAWITRAGRAAPPASTKATREQQEREHLVHDWSASTARRHGRCRPRAGLRAAGVRRAGRPVRVAHGRGPRVARQRRQLGADTQPGRRTGPPVRLTCSGTRPRAISTSNSGSAADRRRVGRRRPRHRAAARRGAPAAPRWHHAAAVATRPRGVRASRPARTRNGSHTSSTVLRLLPHRDRERGHADRSAAEADAPARRAPPGRAGPGPSSSTS